MSESESVAASVHDMAREISRGVAAMLGSRRESVPSLDTVTRAHLVSALLMVAARHAVMIDMPDEVLLEAARESLVAEKRLGEDLSRERTKSQ